MGFSGERWTQGRYSLAQPRVELVAVATLGRVDDLHDDAAVRVVERLVVAGSTGLACDRADEVLERRVDVRAVEVDAVLASQHLVGADRPADVVLDVARRDPVEVQVARRRSPAARSTDRRG